MALTFLQAVNASLKAAKFIQGSSGELTTFTDGARQSGIDLMIDSWNEVLTEFRKVGTIPNETAEGTLTLTTGNSSYSFSTMSITDFEQIVGNPIDATNKNDLTPYPKTTLNGDSGWLAMRQLIVDRSEHKGLPLYYAINTTNGNIEIDSEPTSTENGRAYVFVYEKRIALAAVSDTFPFSDTVVEELQIAVVEVFERKRKDKFDAGLYQAGMSGAAHFANPSGYVKKYGIG